VVKSAPSKVRVTFDGVEVEVQPGISILEAARQHGIHIPVLCYQPNERPVGVCRMCSVEAGEKTLSAACVKPVEDGMVIKTNSEKVKQARGVLVELLLSEHQSPCVRQKRSGDCELEVLAQQEGILAPRFNARTIPRGVDYSSTAIAVDHSACILCDRCIRACNEVRHNDVLGRKGKGYLAGIAFDLDDPMGSSSCISCGECMVSCPTGALTNRTVIPTDLPDGQPADVRFLKGLPYFQGISSTFLELNRNAVVLRRIKAGDTICREGEYGSTAFLMLEGDAQMFLSSHGRHGKENKKKSEHPLNLKKLVSWIGGEIPDLEPKPLGIGSPVQVEVVDLGAGDLFGETSCVNHYPRSETARAVSDCVVLEILRNVLDMMLQRNGDVRRILDSNYRKRALRAHLRNSAIFSRISDECLDSIKETVELLRVQKGETVFRQGAPADSFYVIRSGFVKITQQQIDGELVMAYLGPRQHFGLDDDRPVTATALDHVDLIRIDNSVFHDLMARFPHDRDKVDLNPGEWRRSVAKRAPTRIDVPLQQFVNQGLMQANSVLILDLEKCTRCDACVRACADAHDGVTRLVREGLRFDKYLVATSCRQCRDPLCMVGCPVGSIRRQNSLEIKIEDWCIGCGLCANNCPYGNIHMHPVELAEDNQRVFTLMRPAVTQKATACDLCSGLAEPSCVYACPHDAAQRVDAVKFFGILPGASAAAQ
jgi:CRP-like cAMP-binding protein/Fe-S-cluster-containing dehydrogenase component